MIKRIFCDQKSLWIPFIMCGHPTIESTMMAIVTLIEAGADMIELGVPFSDPIADGPINQQAAQQALQNGTTLQSVLDMVRIIRSRGYDIPLILFTYLNPLLAFGQALFAAQAKSAGIDAVLIVDLPPEEGSTIIPMFQKAGLESVLLVSPTTDPSRLALYQTLNPCFLYYISRLSVTGIQSELSDNLAIEVKQLRIALPNIPIAVGFGISTPEQAAKVADFADGVIIGSALVNILAVQGIEGLRHLANAFSRAIHRQQL